MWVSHWRGVRGLSCALCVGSTMVIVIRQNNWRQSRGSWGTILCLASSCPGAQAGVDLPSVLAPTRVWWQRGVWASAGCACARDDRRSDAAGKYMQAKMTPRRSFPRRLTPPGSMLAMLKQRFGETRAESPRQCESIPYNKGHFAIIGDVQPTSKVEFWRKSNAQERVQLIQQITMESPDFLAIVGDLVFCGSSAANWTAFDTLATPLYDA